MSIESGFPVIIYYSIIFLYFICDSNQYYIWHHYIASHTSYLSLYINLIFIIDCFMLCIRILLWPGVYQHQHCMTEEGYEINMIHNMSLITYELYNTHLYMGRSPSRINHLTLPWHCTSIGGVVVGKVVAYGLGISWWVPDLAHLQA